LRCGSAYIYTDPDPAIHFDADPNTAPTFQSDADPAPTFQFGPGPDPTGTTHFFPDLDPPMLQNDPLKLPLFHCDAAADLDPAFHFDADPDPAFHFAAYPDPVPASQNDAELCGSRSATQAAGEMSWGGGGRG
jgi:hypothetical protein